MHVSTLFGDPYWVHNGYVRRCEMRGVAIRCFSAHAFERFGNYELDELVRIAAVSLLL